MAENRPMPVVLCWHMHQPEYRDLRSGQYQFPWTYLHALKDYADMAAHLENHVGARAVVNFAPVLLEQIADYVVQLDAWFEHGGALRDPLLAALAEPPIPSDPDLRHALMKQCLRANEKRIIERFAPYRRLAAMAAHIEADGGGQMYLSDQFLIDLLVWYHLGWMAESQRRSDPRIAALENKAQGFSVHDRRELLALLREQLQSVLPRYRALAEHGRVELSMSPYAHPILPLLLDLDAGLEAQPDGLRPAVSRYPGGEERARWHLRHGRAVFEQHLGCRPNGCWPSEGALSNAAVALLAEEGFRWTASGAQVLRNSQAHSTGHGDAEACVHRVYRVGASAIDCFFRDDGLSDLIGFEYSSWHAEDAVANLVHHLNEIAARCPDRDNCAITVILDGENAWEYYPQNAWYFLDALYRELLAQPGLVLSTFSELQQRTLQPVQLPALVAGSWVHGTLATWIGSTDKNRGWEMLVDAKHAFDQVLAQGTLGEQDLERARRQLGCCESSDWFWWFGDYNPAESVSDFERLFRQHLANLYQLIGVEPPGYLSEPFTHGKGDPRHGGVMRAADAG